MTTEVAEQPGKEARGEEATAASDSKSNPSVEVKDGSGSDTDSGADEVPELEDPAHAAAQSQVNTIGFKRPWLFSILLSKSSGNFVVPADYNSHVIIQIGSLT